MAEGMVTFDADRSGGNTNKNRKKHHHERAEYVCGTDDAAWSVTP